jgi:hypothetical protein
LNLRLPPRPRRSGGNRDAAVGTTTLNDVRPHPVAYPNVTVVLEVGTSRTEAVEVSSMWRRSSRAATRQVVEQ